MSSPQETGTGTGDAVTRARALLQLRRPEGAEREARGALARDPEDGEAHGVLALALSARGRAEEAVAEAGEAVRLMPGTWWPHHVAAFVLWKADRDRAGLAAARAALRIDPTRAATWDVIARLHLSLKEWWLAVQAAQRGLACDPENSDLVSLQSLALTELANAPGAVALAAEAVRLDPEEQLAHLAAGHAALAAKDRQAAARAFREALRLAPGSDHARELLVIALKQRDPVYRALFRWLNGLGRQHLRLPLALWIPFHIVVAVGHWALWTASAAGTLRLARDPYYRMLLPGREIRAAWLSAGAVAAGALTFAAGVVRGRADLAAAGVAMAALVTPVQETCTVTAQRERMILGGWTVLLTLAITTVVVLSAVAPSPATVGLPLALLAVATVWPAQSLKRKARRSR